MATFLITAAVIMLTLGLVSYISGKRVDHPPSGVHMLSLLPGDIKYESPSGNFRFYFPITTSIVISIVLTLVLWLFSEATAFGLCAGAQGLCDVAQGSLLGVADLHASDPQKATFRRSLGNFPADAGQPGLEGRCIAGRLGGKDRRDLPQISERALNGVGWLGSGK